MPSLNFDDVKLYSKFKTNIFVETGSGAGDTISNVKSFSIKFFQLK